MAKYRVGLIGCGGRQHSHVPAFQANADCEIVAAVDRVEELRSAFAEKWGIERTYDSIGAMLEEAQPDIVTVVTRAIWMREPVLEALAGGVKGVLCEKPFAVDLEEAREMMETADAAGAALLINHQYRFFPHAEKMRSILLGGELGDVEFFRAIGSVKLHGQGTHMIDFVRYLHDDRDFAWALGTFAGGETFDARQPGPDFDTGVLAFADGPPLYVESGPRASRSPYPDEKLNLYADAVCTQGRIWFGLNRGLRIWWPDGRYEEEPASWPQISEPAQEKLVASLIEQMETGTRSRCDAHSALGTQQALCALLASGLEHRTVTFPPEIEPGLMERVRKAVA